jgi:hypothetical protein
MTKPRETHLLRRLAGGVALSCCAALAVACSPIRGYCEAAAECDDFEARLLDPVGEDNDSADVCVAQNEGVLRALRANEEDVCREQADIWEAYMACVAETFGKDEKDACDGFVFSADNPCDDELDDFFKIVREAGDDCSPLER